MKDYAIGDITIHIESGDGLDTIQYGFDSNNVMTFDEFMNMVCEDYFTDDEKSVERITHLFTYLKENKFI